MTNTTNTSTEQSDASSNPNLNIADLVNVLQIIDTCSNRGAFRANELSSVGGLYDRLNTFLVATGAVKGNENITEPAEPAAAQ